MPIKHTLTVTTLMLMLSTGVQSQTRVYETADAQGNTVFSDTPSANSETVYIPETNVTEPPPAMTEPLTSQSRAAQGKASEAPESEQGGRRIVNRDEQKERRMRDDGDGDGFVTEHTADGDILVNEREKERARTEEEYFIDENGVRRIRVHKHVHRGVR